MNRYLLLIFLVAAPTVALTILYELGSAHLWFGYPLAWVNCLYVLTIVSPFGGQCGYYYDWLAFSLDVLFYTGWAYALLGCYKLLRDARQRPGNVSPRASDIFR